MSAELYEVVCQHNFENELGIRNIGPVIVHDRLESRDAAEELAARLRVERRDDGATKRWTAAAVRPLIVFIPTIWASN